MLAGDNCDLCDEEWPCELYRLATEVEQLQAQIAESERRGAEKGWDERNAISLSFLGPITPNPYRTPQPEPCHDGHHVPTCAALVRNAACDQGGRNG